MGSVIVYAAAEIGGQAFIAYMGINVGVGAGAGAGAGEGGISTGAGIGAGDGVGEGDGVGDGDGDGGVHVVALNVVTKNPSCTFPFFVT